MHRTLSRALAIAAWGSLLACSDALLQPMQKDTATLDNRMALRGTVCTAVPDPTGFPVKVVFLVDKSGSMCVLDPPGSQTTGGFCQTYGTAPPGVTEPGRVRAMKQLMKQFSAQPNVSVALVPWETKIANSIPTGPPWFVPVDSVCPGIAGQAGPTYSCPMVENLQADLGKGTDYQGAFADAQTRIEADILATPATQRPRTRSRPLGNSTPR